MTAYGTRRHLYDPKTQADKPYDQTTISLQMGTNKGASQVCKNFVLPPTVVSHRNFSLSAESEFTRIVEEHFEIKI